MSRFFLATAMTVGVPTFAAASRVATTDEGLELSWPGSCVVVHMNELGSEDVTVEQARAAVQQALKAWSQADGSYLRLVYGGLTSTAGAGSPTRRVVSWIEEEAAWTVVGPEVLGMTTITYDAAVGRILDADIEMNGAWFEFTSEDDVVDMDIRSAVMHEVGHLAGLDDSEVLGAVMHPHTESGDLSKRELTEDDRLGIAAIYPPGDDPGVCEEDLVGDYYPQPSAARTASSGCTASKAGGPAGVAWLTILVLALMTLGAGRAHAYRLYTSPADPNVPLRWFSSGQDLWFDCDQPDELQAGAAQALIQESFLKWCHLTCVQELTPFDFTFQGVKCSEIGYDEDPGAANENLIKWITNPSHWDHGAEVLALTSLTYDTVTGEIVDGDLELNDSEFEFSKNPADDEADVENTVVHEAGHFLGLDHSFDVDATMYAKAPLGETIKRDLEDDDVNGYCALYGPDAPPIKTPPPTPLPPTDNGSAGCFCAMAPPAFGPAGLAALLLFGISCVFGARSRGRRTRPPSEPR